MIFIFTAASGRRIHEPSRHRALVREMKSGGRSPQKLICEARKLRDPYYASLTLFSLSVDPRLSLQEAYDIALDAVRAACDVPRLWRRAELLTTLARKMKSWRGNEAAEKREHLMDALLEAVVSMPDGKELSDAIAGCVFRLGCSRIFPLLQRAVSNRGYEAAGAKAVIRYSVEQCTSRKVVEMIMNVLDTLHDPMIKSKLLGYLYLHLRKREASSSGDRTPLHAAIKEVLLMDDAKEQWEALRYLFTVAAAEDIPVLRDAVMDVRDPVFRIKAMVSLAGSADKRGFRAMAVDMFMEALHMGADVEDPCERAVIRMNAACGLARCQMTERARHAYLLALDDCGENLRLKKRICRAMEEHGLQPPEECDTVLRTRFHDTYDAEAPGHILALYNTYEGKLSPIHLRAVARAAPLCIAFGMDLVLMGFPVDDIGKMVASIRKDTTIGRGGAYLEELVGKGRVAMVSSDIPEQWNTLGMPVATTSHPDEKKRVTMEEALRLAAVQHPLRRVCIFMGLGKKGLPISLLKRVPHHLELTGRNVSLETCTAMGVIAQQVHEAQKHLEKKTG